MKKALFRNQEQKLFHLNIDFETQPLFKSLDWIYIQKKINTLLNEYHISLHCLIMMDSHIHLLIQADQKNENFFCENLKKELNIKTETTLESHSEPIYHYSQYLNCYKYIYRNPVEAGLVKKTEDYPYSTLSQLLGRSVSYCEIIDYLALIQNPIQILNWLNNFSEFKHSRLSKIQNSFIS